MEDLIIIGAGPAGITAAIYALRAGIGVTLIEKSIYGGQAAIIDSIENYPGFKKISGVEFSEAMYNQAKGLGAKFVFDTVVSVDLKSSEKSVTTSSGKVFYSKSVIIANGLKRRTLGCEGEKEFFGRGVSYCATCDGAFFREQNVIIVGGGNTALSDALYLSNVCKTVTMVVRRNQFRGEKSLSDAVKKKENINVKFETVVKKICGDSTVKNVVLVYNGDEEILDVSGVFVAIGYSPDNKAFEGQVKMTESGYFESGENCQTNIPGVYVAGDCRNKSLRQIATAVSDGAVCGNAAAEYLIKEKMCTEIMA